VVWRFYARRAAQNLWLDTNVQINPDMVWSVSKPMAANAVIPHGMPIQKGEDGRAMWGRGDTVLFGEEDGVLSWAGICTVASPGDDGLYLEFTGAVGWWKNIPFTDNYDSGHATDVFDVVRMLARHANSKPRTINVIPGQNNAHVVVAGDTQDYPEAPVRAKGQSTKDYEASSAYQQWKRWIEAYEQGNAVPPYSLRWWEAPVVGEEMEALATEYGFDWRESVRWKDRTKLVPQFRLAFNTDLRRRRQDIAFTDGINLASRAVPKEDDEPYADHIIALGAGEGQDMLRQQATDQSQRLYSAQYRQYKSVTRPARLLRLAQSDLARLNQPIGKIDQVEVWNVPGFAPISSLRPGDECKVNLPNENPPYSVWHRIVEVRRSPMSAKAVLMLEASQ
jgi:hypothetical protein